MNEGEFHLMNAGEFHLISHWQFSIRKGGIFRPGAYSLAPLHFRIAQRRTERCKERACPEPCEGRGCAEAYLCTASRSVEIGDRARRNLCGHRHAISTLREAWRSHRPGRKRTFLTSKNPDGNEL